MEWDSVRLLAISWVLCTSASPREKALAPLNTPFYSRDGQNRVPADDIFSAITPNAPSAWSLG